jgi:hypothetical protein
MTSMIFTSDNKKIHHRMAKAGRHSCLALQGGLIQAREYVVVGDASAPVVAVRQLIEIMDHSDIDKSELSVRYKTGVYHRTDCKEKFAVVRHMVVSPKSHDTQQPQVVRTCKLKWIPADDIHSLAFVFHKEKGTVKCRERKNVFVIQQELDAHGNTKPISPKSYDAFCNPFGIENYSKRVWTESSPTLKGLPLNKDLWVNGILPFVGLGPGTFRLCGKCQPSNEPVL